MDELPSRVDPELLQQLAGCTSLPTMPGVAGKLIEIANAAPPDAEAFIALVELDPACTSKLIRIANSPMYLHQQAPVSTAREAATLLGIDASLTLALSCAVHEENETDPGNALHFGTLCQRGVIASMAIPALARMCGEPHAERLSTCALLQDVGVMALNKVVPQLYTKRRYRSHAALCAAETTELGLDHAAVSAWLMRRWGLPEELCQLIRASHDPQRAPTGQRARAAMIALTALLAEVLLQQDLGVMKEAELLASNDLCLAPEQLLELLHHMEEAKAHMQNSLCVTLTPDHCLADLLAASQRYLTLQRA